MAGFPKIALARLKVKPDGLGQAGATAGPGKFVGPEHPDANLLAAFAESALTEKERGEVLDHLNHCADCRAVAAFALPEVSAAMAPAVAAAPRRSQVWRLLRWGAITAALATFTAVVIFHPSLWNRPAEISQVAAPTPTAKESAARDRPAAPPPESDSVAARTSAGKPAVKKAPESHPEWDLNGPGARELARQQNAMMAAPPPSVARPVEQASGMPVIRTEAKAESARSAEALAAPAAAPPPAASSLDAAKVRTESRVGLEIAPAGNAVGGALRGNLAASSAPPASATPAPTAVPMTAHAAIGSMRAMGKAIEIIPVPRIALWRVSADGQVQRSADGGKSYETIHVTDGVKFGVIASLRNDVWAGGTSGTLFHSTDGGVTWVQVAIPFAGGTVTEIITGIQLLDPQRIAITSASGARWVSEDQGQHWQKQP